MTSGRDYGTCGRQPASPPMRRKRCRPPIEARSANPEDAIASESQRRWQRVPLFLHIGAIKGSRRRLAAREQFQDVLREVRHGVGMPNATRSIAGPLAGSGSDTKHEASTRRASGGPTGSLTLGSDTAGGKLGAVAVDEHAPGACRSRGVISRRASVRYRATGWARMRGVEASRHSAASAARLDPQTPGGGWQQSGRPASPRPAGDGDGAAPSEACLFQDRRQASRGACAVGDAVLLLGGPLPQRPTARRLPGRLEDRVVAEPASATSRLSRSGRGTSPARFGARCARPAPGSPARARTRIAHPAAPAAALPARPGACGCSRRRSGSRPRTASCGRPARRRARRPPGRSRRPATGSPVRRA